jgi:uncharacterized protein (DUF952 family)
MATIFKICPAALWRIAESEKVFRGSAVDVEDGFIHFSTDTQVKETAAKHFAGQCDLLLIAIDGDYLGEALVWEPARSGDQFPHLYGSLALTAVLWVEALPLGADGNHRFPVLAR